MEELGVGRDRDTEAALRSASTRSHTARSRWVVGSTQNPAFRGLRRWMRLKLVLFAGAREAAGVAEAQAGGQGISLIFPTNSGTPEFSLARERSDSVRQSN